MAIGAGGVAFLIHIDIDQAAWEQANLDVQDGVMAILALNPIPLLSGSQRGPGIKQESKGVEFHTDTNKRLQAPGYTITKSKSFVFDKYGRGWGH